MNTSKFGAIIGSGASAVLLVGLLTELPAQAGSGLIKTTHSDTPLYLRSSASSAGKTPHAGMIRGQASRGGSAYGNRTRLSALRGPCPN